MYRYKVFFEEGVLLTQFYDEYLEHEGDKSLLAICKSMTIDERHSIKTVIWDLQDVTAMTVANTDIARVAYFERELLKMFEKPGTGIAKHMSEVSIFYIQPEDSAVGVIFRERLARVARATRKTPTLDGEEPRGLPELLESLKLSKLLPSLDGEWQE